MENTGISILDSLKLMNLGRFYSNCSESQGRIEQQESAQVAHGSFVLFIVFDPFVNVFFVVEV